MKQKINSLREIEMLQYFYQKVPETLDLAFELMIPKKIQRTRMPENENDHIWIENNSFAFSVSFWIKIF